VPHIHLVTVIWTDGNGVELTYKILAIFHFFCNWLIFNIHLWSFLGSINRRKNVLITYIVLLYLPLQVAVV